MAGIGLSEAQASAVKVTWGMVEENLKEHGVNVFIALFTEHPHTQQLFKRMKDKPLEELGKTPTLRAHAFGFMKELSGMVENIENPEELICALQANAHRHHKRGVTTKDYELTLGLFHGYLKEKLGEAFTEDASEGWKIVAGAIVSTINAEYDVIVKEKEQTDAIAQQKQ